MTDKSDVIRFLRQMRETLSHALTQPNISPARFNEIRAQILPLDEQLRALGEVDMKVTPQMSPAYTKQTRHERRQIARRRKHLTFTQRVMRGVNND